jgi:hypothetical protein
MSGPRGLAILRCGAASLHPAWRAGAAAADWDLQLSPWQAGAADWPPVRPGLKFEGLHAHLTQDRRWRDYDYVWLPDDDLAATAEDIARLFALCRRFDAALAAPALSADSHFAFAITMHNRAFAARATTYVELMMPCFRRDVLERLLPTFALNAKSWAFGVDMIWAQMLGHRGLYIFDEVRVTHTRPSGGQRDPVAQEAMRRHARRLMARHEVRPLKRTLAGYDAEGRPTPADGGSVLLRYLQGYDYLIARDPKLLARLVADQTRSPRVLRSPWKRLTKPFRPRAARPA